jgi:aminoglycoside/choline kinase family phosphotransferase
MDLFPDWYLRKHRPAMPGKAFDSIWDEVCGVIISSALAQPQCFVHRDFHSCNLLRVSDDDIGIIDFQDGVTGPISYDLVSLLWDRYIRWPRTKIETWVEQFRKELELDIDTAAWLRFCDLMGLQRNLKIVGIFARLNYRDGKRAYLDLIPRFYEYVTDTLGRYPEFSALLNFMEDDRCAP